jgi:lactose/L-arabinose transport system permease protein
MVIGSTNDSLSILRGKLTFGNQLLHNVTILFQDHDMLRIFGNSIKISSITVVLILIITSMAAYGFQIFSSKGKEKLYGAFLLTMMVPFSTLMIPLYQIFAKLHLLNTHFAVIIVSAASVFMVFFFRQSFSNYPKDILQAARVDGAGEFKIFTRIFVPSMKNTYFAAAIYAFMTSWNLYLWPLIALGTNEKKTTTLLISSLSSSYTPEYGTIMVGIVISTLPIIIIFFAFQKQFVEGMLGSVKQ